MLYTIGHPDVYEDLFNAPGDVKKKGRTDDYDGGAVYYSEEEAREDKPDEYRVYGLNATEDQVIENKEETHDNLKEDAPLIHLNK